jgi:hypothetical protein
MTTPARSGGSLNPNSISMNNLSTIATVATASQVVPHVGIVREAGNDIVSGVSNSFVQINLGLLSKFVQTICKSSASGPESSWLRGALLLIGAVALLSLTACANQSGANGKPMPWYERTPAAAPMR